MEKVKLNKIYLKVLQVTVFGVAVYFISQRISGVSWTDEKSETEVLVSTSGIFLLFVVFVLQFANWGLEAGKFMLVLGKFQKITYKKAVRAVYKGNAIGIVTPDRLGTFAGRRMEDRTWPLVSVLAATMVGNIAQLLTTLLFGTLALALNLLTKFQLLELGLVWNLLLGLVACVVVLIFLAIYLNFHKFGRFIRKWKWMTKFEKQLEYLDQMQNTLYYKVLLLSILRYLIFSFQLWLLFYLLQIPITGVLFFVFIGLLYAITTFIPSPFMGNLGTREAVALFLIAIPGVEWSLLISLFILWLINVAFPALAGSVLLMKDKR